MLVLLEKHAYIISLNCAYSNCLFCFYFCRPIRINNVTLMANKANHKAKTFVTVKHWRWPLCINLGKCQLLTWPFCFLIIVDETSSGMPKSSLGWLRKRTRGRTILVDPRRSHRLTAMPSL